MAAKGYLWRSAEIRQRFLQSSRRAGLKDRADDEYRRLLYVGMTRAEDRLIVCGYHGKRARNAATWHSIVSRALVGIPETEERPDPVTGETVHRFRMRRSCPPWRPDRHDDCPRAACTPSAVQTAAGRGILPRPLSPSGARY